LPGVLFVTIQLFPQTTDSTFDLSIKKTNDNLKNKIMKKLFISALLAITVAASSFAAGGNTVNLAALKNFKAEFKKASDVQWSFRGKLYNGNLYIE
jgi:hypothetical protein